jgi:hypothetical protein
MLPDSTKTTVAANHRQTTFPEQQAEFVTSNKWLVPLSGQYEFGAIKRRDRYSFRRRMRGKTYWRYESDFPFFNINRINIVYFRDKDS